MRSMGEMTIIVDFIVDIMKFVSFATRGEEMVAAGDGPNVLSLKSR